MPQAGAMVFLSHAYIPAHLQGMIIDPHNPLQFNFLVHRGDSTLNDFQKHQEYQKLIKYFLASLTIPDDDQWVNLSPYEKNRIISQDFGLTEMGRDLLTQDYLLKQITSSLIYPEVSLGKEFWNKVYERSAKLYGQTAIPVNTFNKVWITPDEAVVYESGNTAYIIKTHLKVMLEEDYLSLRKHLAINVNGPAEHSLTSKIIKQIILPQLEKEVNEGQNFALLRQIYSSMVLATWYKRSLKESILGRVYADKSKVKGVDQDPKTNELIYQQYLKAFKKGVFNYIKEDYDALSHQEIPRKYFAGGWAPNDGAMRVMTQKLLKSSDARNFYQSYQQTSGKLDNVTILLDPAQSSQGPKGYTKALIGGGIVALVAAAGIGKVLLTPHQNQPSSTSVVIATASAKDTELAQIKALPKDKKVAFFVEHSLQRLMGSKGEMFLWSVSEIDELVELARAVDPKLGDEFKSFFQAAKATAEQGLKPEGEKNVMDKYKPLVDYFEPEHYFVFYNGIDKDGPAVRFMLYRITNNDGTYIKIDNKQARIDMVESIGGSQNATALGGTATIHGLTIDGKRSYVFPNGVNDGVDFIHQVLSSNGAYFWSQQYDTADPNLKDAITQLRATTVGLIRKDFPNDQMPDDQILKKLLSKVFHHEGRHQIDFRTSGQLAQNTYDWEARGLSEEEDDGGLPYYSLADWTGHSFGKNNENDLALREFLLYAAAKESLEGSIERDKLMQPGIAGAKSVNIILQKLSDLSRPLLTSLGRGFIKDRPKYDFGVNQGNSSPAMNSSLDRTSPFGGIDLNAANMNFIIKRDAHGLPLPLVQQDLAQLSRISGFIPRILDIHPFSQPLGILQEIESKIIPTNSHSN